MAVSSWIIGYPRPNAVRGTGCFSTAIFSNLCHGLLVFPTFFAIHTQTSPKVPSGKKLRASKLVLLACVAHVWPLSALFRAVDFPRNQTRIRHIVWQDSLPSGPSRTTCLTRCRFFRMTDVLLTPSVRNLKIIQEWWINFVSSRVTLDGTQVVDETVRVHAILKSFLVTSCMKKIKPFQSRPFRGVLVAT